MNKKTWLPPIKMTIVQQQIILLKIKMCSRNVIKYKIQIIDVSDEVWMWVHWKYGMSGIVQKMHSFETNNWSYLTVPDNNQLNRWSNETYYLQWTNSKIMMTKTININRILIHSGINMYNSRLWYPSKQKNLTYLNYNNDFSTTNSVTSR